MSGSGRDKPLPPSTSAATVGRDVDSRADTRAAPAGKSAGRPPRPDGIAHYRIVRELGAGGMGCVYEAHDLILDRRVALKVLAGHLAHSPQAAERFEREAWVAGRLDHPNLVPVFERGEWEGTRYFTMQYVDGGSLGDVVRRLRETGRDERHGLVFGTRDYVVWVLAHLVTAARAIDYAHRHGVVHRDIKPMNLLLSAEDGAIKVADFGLALEAASPRLTTVGSVLGTIAYMAPEQVLGRSDEIGVATDVYALGVTLFELLTLELPYGGATQQLYVQEVLTGSERRASRINARVGSDLETVIHKALEKEPQDRYASAAAFADDLQAVLDFRPIQARRLPWPRRAVKAARRRPAVAALLALALVSVPTIGLLAQRAVAHRRLATANRVETLWREARFLAERPARQRDVVERASAILALDPAHLPALRARAFGYRRLAEEAREDAERSRLRGLALADVARLTELAPDAAWPQRLAADTLRQFGREDDARAADGRAAERRGTVPSDEDQFLDALLAYDRGDFDAAIAGLSPIVARKPQSLAELRWRARSYAARGDVEAALIDYRVAAAINPEDVFSYFDLGELLGRMGKFDEAQTYLRRALEIEPGRFEVREALADNLLAEGRAQFAEGARAAAQASFAAAEREARQALALNPAATWARIDLGASLMEAERSAVTSDPRRVAAAIDAYEEAFAALQRAGGAADPRALVAVSANLCDALIQQRQLTRALAVCRAAADANPDEAVAHYNLAGAYALLGRREEALAELERDVALGDRDAAYLAADPWFGALRDESRFAALVARMQAP